MRSFKSVFSIILAVAFLFSIQSLADTFVVTNLNDPGAGSLRQAIDDSNLTPGPDEIVFEEGLTGTIVLNLGHFGISDDLNINGPGADMLTIDADDSSRIFNISDGSTDTDILVSISGLMFINGSSGGGGAIYNIEVLTIDACVFVDNNAGSNGGAIDNNEGTIEQIKNSTFSGNSADNLGGAISNGGAIEQIKNSTFSENSAEGGIIPGGGAIYNFFTITAITNSTFSGNSTHELGGAIYNDGATIEEITNSTFSGNFAGTEGGAIWNSGDINISFSTIANNVSDGAGGGLFESGASINIRNSIVAFNTGIYSGPNCNGDIATEPAETNNYSEDDSCGFDFDDSTIQLGPLADNGGPTQTMALLGGDPLDGASVECDALDSAGEPTGMPIGIDQRFFPRPFGPDCDSGAYEAGSSVPEGPEEPEGPPGPSGSSCAVAGSGNGNNGLAGLLIYAFTPLAIIIRRRFRRK